MQSGVTELRVSGMTCQNCVRHVTEALREVPGVSNVSTDLEGGAATVRWAPGSEPAVDKLLGALREAGYSGAERSEAGAVSIFEGWKFNVVLGSFVTIPLILLEWVGGFGLEVWYKWLSFALVLPLQVFGGWRFYRGAWLQLKSGQSNMDTLVSLGSTTAFLYSVWGLLAGWNTHLYFMDAAAILTLVSLGHYLEEKASAQAASSLRALLDLAPQTARRIKEDREEDVPVAALRPEDRVLLKPGDRIPIDGTVVEGGSSVDESMLTGESIPVEKQPGSKVYAGTINESGTMQLRVTATGQETALAHIIDIVQRAQSSRAEIQRLGDRVSSVFVPVVVVIALATAAWWGFFPEAAARLHAALAPFLWHAHSPETAPGAAIFHAAAVLIIACPCAMGLATPIAIMAGTNAAAKRGILVRDGAALEKSGRISTILFDKTGTLTQGKLTVADREQFNGSTDGDVASAMARRSAHPVSKAIAALSGKTVAFKEWREVRGSGIEASTNGTLYRLGRIDWLVENGVAVPGENGFLSRWRNEGASIVGLAHGRDLLSLYALKDSPKPGARAVCDELQQSGYAVYLVTGDNAQTARTIAAQLGIPAAQVFAEVRPEGKLKVVEELRASGRRVAFVGDGINDAPALQAADLGIALMNATDVAREQADIVLLRSDLHGIPESLRLAQATLRTIKQNLFWAFFYNALGVPLAALGFLSPMFSAFAMGMSDLVVIGNALRLKRNAARSFMK